MMRVFGYFIEFFASLAIVDVMKMLRTNGMIGAVPVGGMGDHRRVRPFGFWVTNQRRDASAFVLLIYRQSAKIEKRWIKV